MSKACLNCGIDYRHIASKHRLGCAFCYFIFKTEMHYVFKEKQDNKHVHKGKIPKNYTDPVKVFVNQQIENKIENEITKKKLKEKINLNHYHGD